MFFNQIQEVKSDFILFFPSGLGRLFGEDLVLVRREASLDVAGTLRGDHGPGGELREHANRRGKL